MTSYASVENLKKLEAYRYARVMSRIVWNNIIQWDILGKKTIGGQWVESTDSISANIAEGYGRFFYKDTIKFYYYARGSYFESCDWFSKAVERTLISEQDQQAFRSAAHALPKSLNTLIKYTRVNAERNKIIKQ